MESNKKSINENADHEELEMGRVVVAMGGATGASADTASAREQRTRARIDRQRRFPQTVPRYTLRHCSTQISGKRSIFSIFLHI